MWECGNVGISKFEDGGQQVDVYGMYYWFLVLGRLLERSYET